MLSTEALEATKRPVENTFPPYAVHFHSLVDLTAII